MYCCIPLLSSTTNMGRLHTTLQHLFECSQRRTSNAKQLLARLGASVCLNTAKNSGRWSRSVSSAHRPSHTLLVTPLRNCRASRRSRSLVEPVFQSGLERKEQWIVTSRGSPIEIRRDASLSTSKPDVPIMSSRRETSDSSICAAPQRPGGEACTRPNSPSPHCPPMSAGPSFVVPLPRTAGGGLSVKTQNSGKLALGETGRPRRIECTW